MNKPLHRSVDAHRDRADVAGAAAPYSQERVPAAVAKHGIDRVAGVASRPARVRRFPVGGVGQGVGEVELARVHDVAAHVHLDVDVHRPARVPAGVDGLEGRHACSAGPLDATHERGRGRCGRDTGVHAERVAMPDVDRGSLDRFARRRVEDGEAQRQNSHKTLVVDDEPSIVDAVATALRYEDYVVEEAATGREALSAVARFHPDLIVLDWMLPDIEGIEVGRRLREQGYKTAVLFLTAKDATENKVEALPAGGDDYVTKPFSLAEIVARVQAILRRSAGPLPGDVLRFGDLTLDEDRHEVRRGETEVTLTGTEFALLRFFMLNPRRVLSKAQILQNV